MALVHIYDATLRSRYYCKTWYDATRRSGVGWGGVGWDREWFRLHISTWLFRFSCGWLKTYQSVLRVYFRWSCLPSVFFNAFFHVGFILFPQVSRFSDSYFAVVLSLARLGRSEQGPWLVIGGVVCWFLFGDHCQQNQYDVASANALVVFMCEILCLSRKQWNAGNKHASE